MACTLRRKAVCRGNIPQDTNLKMISATWGILLRIYVGVSGSQSADPRRGSFLV